MRRSVFLVGPFGVGTMVALCFLSNIGCDESDDDLQHDCVDGGVTYCTDEGDGTRLCVVSSEGNFWDSPDLCPQGEVCVQPFDPEESLDATCVAGTGGTGGTAGSGGTGGTGGTAGSGGTGGTGGTAGSGGTAGTGGGGSCLEVDIAGLPQLAGTLVISPTVATFDDFMTVTADVDADTKEVTALLRNESSGFLGGSGVALTNGNETVEIGVRVETTAEPGLHVLDLELRANPLNQLDYTLYTPGDGATYVRIDVENGAPGPIAATTCLVVNATIQ